MYGDEAQFLINLVSGYQHVCESIGLFKFLKNLYFFNPTYPGGMYWLTLPFLSLKNNDMLFNVRFFSFVVHLFGVVVFYRTLQKIVAPLWAFIGCVFLLSSTIWVYKSHFYYTDGLLGVEIMTLYYLGSRYFEQRNEKNIFLCSICIMLGFLTKFSWIIYLPSFVVTWFVVDLSMNKGKVIESLLCLVKLFVPSIILAGPWYYSYFLSGSNAYVNYKNNSFYILKNENILDAIKNILKYFYIDFSLLFNLFLIGIVVLLIVMAIKKKKSFLHSFSASEVFLICGSFLFVLFSSACLEFLGRTWIIRWNFNSYFLVIIVTWGGYRFINNKILTGILFLPLLLQLFYVHTSFGFSEKNDTWVKKILLPNAGTNIIFRPDNRPTHIEDIPLLISHYNEKLGGGRYIASGANFHIHYYAHNTIFKALDFLNNNTDAQWQYNYNPPLKKRIEIEALLGLDNLNVKGCYLVIERIGDDNLSRSPWINFFKKLPESFFHIAKRVATIFSPGRGGHPAFFDIYYINKDDVTAGFLADMAAVAEICEHQEFRLYQRLKAAYYRLVSLGKFNGLQFLDVKREIDSLAVRSEFRTLPGSWNNFEITEKLASEIIVKGVSTVPDTIFKFRQIPDPIYHDIDEERLEEGIVTIGPDPYVIFTAWNKNDESKFHKVEVTIDSPEVSTIQLFFKKKGSGYTEQNSFRKNLDAGKNECIFNLDSGLDGRIRLDIAGPSGVYKINSVAIYTNDPYFADLDFLQKILNDDKINSSKADLENVDNSIN
jgi:hypothetical protein